MTLLFVDNYIDFRATVRIVRILLTSGYTRDVRTPESNTIPNEP